MHRFCTERAEGLRSGPIPFTHGAVLETGKSSSMVFLLSQGKARSEGLLIFNRLGIHKSRSSLRLEELKICKVQHYYSIL